MFQFIREAFPLNRTVALLTPLVATLAGTVSAWLADHLPFVADQVGPAELKLVFLGAMASTAALAYKWLEGWQDYEADARDEKRG